MTLKAAHGIAQSNTPSGVEVPQTWTGIVVWAVGKFGIGIIGFIAIVPLYLDLKASNERFAKITEANIQAITVFSTKLEESNRLMTRVDDTLRRIETTARQQ